MFCRTVRLAPVALLLLAPCVAVLASAQQAEPTSQLAPSPQPVSLIAPGTPGRLQIMPPAGWVVSSIALEDGTSPVVTLSDPETSLTASYSLFPSHAAQPTPDTCRNEALTALLLRLNTDVKLRDRRNAVRTGPDGATLATTSFVLASADAAAPHTADQSADQTDFFAFTAGPGLCAELHLSKAPAATIDDSLLAAPIALFRFEPAYAPTVDDYAGLGAVYAEQINDHIAAALYYERALQSLPTTSGDPALTARRRAYTDEIFTAYLLAQDRTRARATEEAALTTDSGYPFYYYNLACLDAEDGNAKDAQRHLQQAFDRRAGLAPDERLPGPAADESILKLKDDKAFWKFVERLK